MRARTFILFIMAAGLLLGSLAFGQSSNRPSLAAPGSFLEQSDTSLTVQYTVKQGVSSGGGYRITGMVEQVSIASSAGAYRLLSPDSPAVVYDMCCCTYLPCVRK